VQPVQLAVQGVEEDAESKLEEINSNSAGQKTPRKNEEPGMHTRKVFSKNGPQN
jgi:hypothetical protein